MICLKLNWFFYDPSWMLHFAEFVWMLRSSVWVVFNHFLLIDATDRSKISSDRKRLFFALRLYPLSFFASTPFKVQGVATLQGRLCLKNWGDFLQAGWIYVVELSFMTHTPHPGTSWLRGSAPHLLILSCLRTFESIKPKLKHISNKLNSYFSENNIRH